MSVARSSPATRRAVAPRCHAHTLPRPSSPPGTRPSTSAPHPSCQKRDIPKGRARRIEWPHAREPNSIGPGSGRLIPGPPPRGLRDRGRVSPNTCWVQSPTVRRADTATARSPNADRKENLVPALRMPRLLLNPTKAVDWMIFSLDKRNLIRVRRAFAALLLAPTGPRTMPTPTKLARHEPTPLLQVAGTPPSAQLVSDRAGSPHGQNTRLTASQSSSPAIRLGTLRYGPGPQRSVPPGSVYARAKSGV